MLEIKLLTLTLTLIFICFPTMAFGSNEFAQKIQREHAQPCINQMLTQLEKIIKMGHTIEVSLSMQESRGYT